MINAETQSQPNITSPTPAVEPENLKQSQQLHLFQLYAIKIVAILLILQGLWSLFNSVKFIFIDLPSLEQQLQLGQISELQINTFANRAIVMTISTILSLFLALKITMAQSKTAKAIVITIAILLVIGNTQINNFLTQLDSSQLITTAVIETLKSTLSF